MTTKLRTGWTTGACATAGARAAVEGLLTGRFPDPVRIRLPGGQTPAFALAERGLGDGWAEAAVVKDAGDDPDVTHGATVRTRVAIAPAGTGIAFRAGAGVGIVTKPGLPVPPGEPAINPAPRAMIRAALEEFCASIALATDFTVTIGVDGGAALAGSTWNPRLGIEGGLSILGTTGIVRPFSCAAWIASIHRGVDVAVADGLQHVVGATGSRSEAAAAARYPALPPHAFLDMGDFAGGLVKYLRRHPVPRLTVAGGIGKMTKLAQGALDLHSGRSQVDFARLAVRAPAALQARVAQANTALEALQIAGPPLAQAVADDAAATLRALLAGAPVAVETLVTDREGRVHGHRPFP